MLDRARVEVQQLDGGGAGSEPREKGPFLLGWALPGGPDLIDSITRYDGDAVGVADHPIAGPHINVACRCRATDRSARNLASTPHCDHGTEHGKLMGFQRGHVADPIVDDHPGNTADLGRGREHFGPVPAVGRVAGIDDQHRPWRRRGQTDVDGEVVGEVVEVVGPAAHDGIGGPRKPRRPRPGSALTRVFLVAGAGFEPATFGL
jgi:hypothetical protein